VSQSKWEDSAIAAVEAAFQEQVKLVCMIRFRDDVRGEVSKFDRKKFMAGISWAWYCLKESLDGIAVITQRIRDEKTKEQDKGDASSQVPKG
jgi:hypothetical protein